MENGIKNTGLIYEPRQEKDWVFGGVTGAVNNDILFPTGHGWLSIQRDEETQKNRYFDTFSCVTFASLKALSYYFKKVYNIDVDFSERFTAVMSNTIPGRGNSIRNVLESIRKDGFLEEADMPFTDNMTENQYFARPTGAQIAKAKANLSNFRGLGPVEIEWECISDNPFTGGIVAHDEVKEALKYSPVITTGFAWAGGPPVYVNAGPPNHCFLVADYEDEVESDIKADDSYPFDWQAGEQPDANYIKRLSRFYNLYSAYKITATLTKRKPSRIINWKNMFSKMRGYMDAHGLNIFWVDKAGRQKIEMTTMAEKALYMSAFADGDIKKSSWAELQPLKDAKYF